MPAYNPLENPRIAEVLIPLKQLTIEEAALVRDYLSKRIIELESKKLHPEKRIEDIGLSKRAVFFLKKQKLYTVQDVLNFSFQSLLMSKGLGEHTYKEICMKFKGKVDIPFKR